MPRSLALFLSTAALCLSAAHASAQRKPDPPAWNPGPGGPDLDKFRTAYERANSPVIAVVVERVVGPKGEPGALFDPTGDTLMLRAKIREVLRLLPEVELVEPDSLDAAGKQQVENMRLNNEREAINLLAQRINAEVVLLAKMQPAAIEGAAYRVVVTATDIPRGRLLSEFAFDWRGGREAEWITAYANDICRKFIDGFDSHFGVGEGPIAERNITVMLIGVTDSGMVAKAIEDFNRIRGVRKVKVRQGSAGPRSAAQQLTVTYSGDSFDLANNLAASASRSLHMDVRISEFTEGTISLIARPRKTAEQAHSQARWEQLNEDPPAAEALRALKQAYEAKGIKKIGLLINRELTREELEADSVREELKDSGHPNPGSENTYITVIAGDLLAPGRNAPPEARPDGRDAPRDPGRLQLNTEQMETALLRRFSHDFKFQMIVPSVARNTLRKDSDRARRVFEEQELVNLLMHEQVAHILILGRGRIDIADNGATTLVYTFRAVQLSDATFLAGATVTRDVDRRDATAAIADATGSAAREAAARLADDLITKWSPPTRMRIKVHNANNDADLLRLGEAIRALPAIRRIDYRGRSGGLEGGVGEFDAEYDCPFEDLMRAFNTIDKQLPFQLDPRESNPESLTFRIRDSR